MNDVPKAIKYYIYYYVDGKYKPIGGAGWYSSIDSAAVASKRLTSRLNMKGDWVMKVVILNWSMEKS